MKPATHEVSSVSIQVKSLRKSFGAQAVLRGIDLKITQGETLAVLGRSGTGKSVLLKIIVGLERPDSGSVRIHGHELSDLTPKELGDVRRTIGFLFQSAALYDSLTVEENVAFPLRRHTDLSESQLRRRVQELLSSVGL